MPLRQNRRLRIALCVAALCSVVGCRERAPEPPLHRDLGSQDDILLPPPAPRYAIKSAKPGEDRADWLAFRDPSVAPEKEAEATEETTDTGEVEAEIRELIAGYNEVAADRDVEELLGYFAEDLQEQIKPLIEAAIAASDKVKELGESLAGADQAAVESVSAALSRLPGASGAGLEPVSVMVASENEAHARLAPGSLLPKCRFVVLDDEWFITLPEGVDPGQIKERLDATLALCTGWLEKPASERPATDELLATINASVEGTESSPHGGNMEHEAHGTDEGEEHAHDDGAEDEHDGSDDGEEDQMHHEDAGGGKHHEHDGSDHDGDQTHDGGEDDEHDGSDD